MSTAATHISPATRQQRPSAHQGSAEQRVQAEIKDMLQINGNTPTARSWVPRVVMMAYELRCANNPADGEMAECYSVAKELASTS